MSDPRRLLEDATGFERELLDSASLDDPGPARRRRLVAAAAATTTIAASATSAAGIATWKLVGILLVGSLAASVAQLPREQVATVDPPSAPIARAPVALPTVAPSVLAPTPAVIPSATVPVVVSVMPKPAAVPAPSSKPDLAREIRWIDAARAAVASKDRAAALAALDGYDRECAGGSLAIEAQVLRVEATGSPALARAFLAAHPDSPYAARVRKFVAEP